MNVILFTLIKINSKSLNGLSLCIEALCKINATKTKADELKSNLSQIYIQKHVISKQN